MKQRIPKRYTVLIACTGREPLTLSFQPSIVLMSLVLSVSLPTAWAIKTFYSYQQRTTNLVEQNSQLSEEAADILRQVEALEGEIENLQERAGMPEAESSPARSPSKRSQGGEENTISAELLLQVARAKLPGLRENLQGEVQPALEQTLDREASRPRGVPLKGNAEISSKFGLRRNPFGRNYEFHAGLDFRGAYGTPIHVTAPGVVVKAESSGGYGYHVVVDHGYGYRTLYAHMSAMAVTPGTQVERDRVIGYLGNTGRSSGPHVHYAVYLNGNAMNPQYYLK